MRSHQLLILCCCCSMNAFVSAGLQQQNLRGRRTTTQSSAACSTEQLEEFACQLNEQTSGAYVCRLGFKACIAPENHRSADKCGKCPGSMQVVEPTLPPPPPSLSPIDAVPVMSNGPSLCSKVDPETFAPCGSSANDGTKTHTWACMGPFTACVPIESIKDKEDAFCGCCGGLFDPPACKKDREPILVVSPFLMVPVTASARNSDNKNNNKQNSLLR